ESATRLDRVGDERLRVVHVPAERGLTQNRNLVGLPKRNRAVLAHQGRGVRNLEADLVRVTPRELREVTGNKLHVRTGVVADPAGNSLAERNRDAQQGADVRIDVDLRARAGESTRNEHGVTRLVAAGHQRRAHRRSSSPVGDVVNLIGSDLVDTGQQVGDHVIPGRQVKGLSVRLNGDAVAGHTVDDRAIVFGTNQRGPAQRVHVVENSQVGRTRDRAGELSRKLRVQAVNVLPGELLRHRHDDGKLDRGKRLGAAELVPGNRLLGTLTVLK